MPRNKQTTNKPYPNKWAKLQRPRLKIVFGCCSQAPRFQNRHRGTCEDITCDAQCILISYSPCKFLVIGDPIFSLRGLLPIGLVALQSTIDDVYSCAKALKSKDFGKSLRFCTIGLRTRVFL